MNVRAHISMVFHLDKCIGCHTCSISCKNIWTDRKGTEYMWWNNVETKPGSGYPSVWEDQDKYKGGWEKKNGKLQLRTGGRLKTLGNVFFNPYLPSLDDYYEPWTYTYEDLFNLPESEDQPTARPISMIDGRPIEVNAGPNWDDDLSGTPLYARNDPNLKNITDEEKQQLFEIERLVFFYVPRICNHCINPGCAAACPSGAIYKRGEDGIVLVNQDACRGWRMCISSCPYKKVYYNWTTGKSEKCVLCFPRLESGQPPACFHSCVGRIRYLGVLLYDADRMKEVAELPDEKLVEGQRAMILDPTDPVVFASARQSGIAEAMLESAKRSPVLKYVKKWNLALPLHPEYRTLPMLFYVPPLLPVMASAQGGTYKSSSDFFSSLESARVPMQYMANMFAAGNRDVVTEAYKRLIAVRIYKRFEAVGDLPERDVQKALQDANLTPEEAEEIFRLTSLSTFEERFVVPPLGRERAIEAVTDPLSYKGSTGTGTKNAPDRRW